MSLEEEREERKKRNRDLIERMKRGESLTGFNKMESWYPQRPIIKKDQKALDLLRGRVKRKLALKEVKDD